MTEVVETPEGYRYYLIEGRREVSVTTALGFVFRYGGWAGFDPTSATIVTARRRGTAVHKAASILARGKTIERDTLHPIIKPYVAQFTDFLVQTGFRATGSEIYVRSDRYNYAGRLDLVGDWPGDEGGILDVKTTEDVWLAGYQVAAYHEAYREMTGDKKPRKRGTLILSNGPPSKWKLRELPMASDLTVFLSALNCFHVAESAGRLAA